MVNRIDYYYALSTITTTPYQIYHRTTGTRFHKSRIRNFLYEIPRLLCFRIDYYYARIDNYYDSVSNLSSNKPK